MLLDANHFRKARFPAKWAQDLENSSTLADLNEAGRAADAAREVNGAVVACWLR
jgi:hypothetical protein